MKTSNKLLIVFAVALILIPVIGMVIVSATQYKTGTQKDVVFKVENFSTPTKDMTSMSVSSPFKAVILADAKGLDLNIRLIKDEKFGVKIPDGYKDLVSLTVDQNGQLQFSIKPGKANDENEMRWPTQIYIYAPDVNHVAIANANNIVLRGSADLLDLTLNQIGSFYFDNGTKIKQMNLNASKVNELVLRQDDIQSINVVLKDTKFAIEAMSLVNAIITTNGNTDVSIANNREGKVKQTINNMVLNTNGIANVNIENTLINNCEGKLSNETVVKMPAVNLNQMYLKY